MRGDALAAKESLIFHADEPISLFALYQEITSANLKISRIIIFD